MALLSRHSTQAHTILAVSLLLLLPFFSFAQITAEVWVVDGVGGGLTNGVYGAVFAAGQPGVIGGSTGAGFRNTAGFLTSFLLHPDRDNDTDGIADEDDPDDDDDLLPDASELSGSEFDPGTETDPMQVDSDADGMSDGAESVAGTNPRDAGSRLQITGVEITGGVAAVSWDSRDGYTYELVCASSPDGLATSPAVVDTVTASGGAGDWGETSSEGTNAVGAGGQFYRVQVVP